MSAEFEVTPEGHKLLVLATPNCVSVMMYVEGGPPVMATVAADFVGECWWLSRALVPKPEARGKGYGSTALRRLLQEIKATPKPVVQVAPGGYADNKEQQFNFYLKNGFKPVADDGLFEWRPS